MSKKFAYGTVLLLTLIYIFSFIDRQIVAVLGNQIRDSLILSNFQIGLLYGPAFSFIYAISGIPMGRLADRTSRKWMILIGLFTWSLMTVLSGFAASFTFLIVARLFVGLSQSMLSPAVYSLMADAFSPQKRATVFSVYASGIFIGVGLSFLIGGSISLNYDWQTAMIAVGLPGIVLVPFVLWLLKEPDRITKSTLFENNLIEEVRLILMKPAVRWHLTGFSALACTGYTLLAFIGTLFNDVYGRPELISIYGCFMFGVACTVILSGRLADVLAKKDPSRRFWLGMVAAIGGIPFYLYGLFTSNTDLGFISMGIGVLISSSYNGVAAALLQYFVHSHQRALAGGLYLFVISIAGFGLGPPLTGWMSDVLFTGDYAISKSIITVVLICSTIAVYSFRKAMKHYSDDAISADENRVVSA